MNLGSVLFVIGAIYVAINIYPTVKTLRVPGLGRSQQVFRLSAIWLVPLFGGLTMSLFYVIGQNHGPGPYDVGNDHGNYNEFGDGGE